MQTKRLLYIMENLVEIDTKNKNVVYFCNYFKSKNIQVTFLTTKNDENKSINFFGNSIPVIRFSTKLALKKGKKPLFFPFSYLIKNIKNYDTIWCYLNMPSSFYSAIMQKYFHKKLMIKCDMTYPTKNSNKFNRLWKYLTVDFPLSRADFILTESKEVYKKVMNINPRGIVKIIPNGVPIKNFIEIDKNLGSVSKENIILSVGRLQPYKGIKELISAYAIFHKKYPNWKLHIVGPQTNNTYVKELKTLIKKLFPNNKIVQLTGPKFGKDLFSIMKKAKIFVVASHKDSRGDGFSNVLPQAMFFGATPIITDAGGLWTQVEGLPIKPIPSKNISTLANALEYSVKNTIAPTKLRKYVKDKYDWDKNLSKIHIP